MKVFIQKVILILIISLIAVGFFLYWAVKSPFFWSKAIEQIGNYSLRKTGGGIRNVQITQLQCDSDHLEFNQISGRIIYQNKIYQLEFKGLSFDGISSLFHESADIRSAADWIKVKSEDLEMEIKEPRVQTSFSPKDNQERKLFEASAQEIKYNDLSCSHMRAQGKAYSQNIEAESIQADCYEGKITARFRLSYAKILSYQTDIDFIQVNLSRLENVNREVFSNLRGFVDGNVRISEENGKAALESHLKISSGGEVRAELLKPLLQYIPQSLQRKELEKLIREDGLVSLDKGVVYLKSISDEKLSSQINLESRKLNLNTNLTVDVNVDGGIRNYYKHLMKTFNK